MNLESFIGRPWSEGYNCADFVEEVTGFDVRAVTGEQAMLLRTKYYQDGDIVLMTHGELFHVGIVYGDRQHVAHNLKDVGVVSTPITKVGRLGLAIEGYYRINDRFSISL